MSLSEFPKARIGRWPMCWLNADRFSRFVVDEVDLRLSHEDGFAVLHLKFGDDAGADDLSGRDSIHLGCPGTHEFNTTAGHDEYVKTARAQVNSLVPAAVDKHTRCKAA